MVTLTKTPAACWDTAGLDLTDAEYAAYAAAIRGPAYHYVEADHAANLREQYETRLRIARVDGDAKTAAAYEMVLREVFGELLGGSS